MPQARGSVDVTVVSDQTVPVTLTMNTTIARIDVTPAPPIISRNGGRLSLVATPYDAQNRVVLTAPSSWKWTPASSGLITVTSDGEKAVVSSTGTGSGTVSLTAREDEAGKEQAVTVTVLDGTPLASGEWPKARGNARNTGQIAGVQGPITNPAAKWVYTATGGQYPITPPIIGTDGTIYVGMNGGNLVALDPDDGSVRWSVAAAISAGGGSGSPSANIGPPPALTADDILHVLGGDGVLRALRASDGSVKWQTATGAIGRSRRPGHRHGRRDLCGGARHRRGGATRAESAGWVGTLELAGAER